MRATLEELAAVGYAGLTFEAVAIRVDLAKTTLYRRYANKARLVEAAILRFVDAIAVPPPDTGSLRTDLIAVGEQAVRFASSVVGRSLLKVGLDCPEQELLDLNARVQAEKVARDLLLVDRAVARGEIQSGVELKILIQVLVSALIFRVGIKREHVDELDVAAVVELLMNGVPKPATAPGRRNAAKMRGGTRP